MFKSLNSLFLLAHHLLKQIHHDHELIKAPEIKTSMLFDFWLDQPRVASWV